MKEDENHKPRSVDKCRQRFDWPKWKNVIQSRLDSLVKRKVFELVVQTSEGVNSVRYT